MSGGRRLTRRRLLVVGGLSAAALGAGGIVRLLDDEETRPSRLAAALRSAMGAESLRRIGRAYLDGRRDGATEADLDRELRARRGFDPPPAAGEAAAVVAAAARDDFRAGRVVSVRGWYLSETEARACAVASLA